MFSSLDQQQLFCSSRQVQIYVSKKILSVCYLGNCCLCHLYWKKISKICSIIFFMLTIYCDYYNAAISCDIHIGTLKILQRNFCWWYHNICIVAYHWLQKITNEGNTDMMLEWCGTGLLLAWSTNNSYYYLHWTTLQGAKN